ncbi:MAG: flagellar M-ring protein FliF [Achromobacter sp.]|nr:flagellar M-ring protein FliF [Achromobacter sp.]
MNQQATLSASLLAKFPVLEKIRALPKPILLGAAAAVVALIVAVAMWSSEPKYKVLFSNLDDRDGGAIVTALGTMNVPYKYNDTGTALLVPADRVYDARLQLASQGLPRGGSVGFELMDNARFGASQFAEQINYQRGLEGELARSIESMHTVQHARVHLAMPRQSLFVRERQPPTASVLLNVYPGRSLSDAQVSAISWLVASSVPELTAENVSVVDQNGRLLSSPLGEGRGMDADQTRMVRETEQRTVERILTILNPLVGPGNVHAQASAEMDGVTLNLTEKTETDKPITLKLEADTSVANKAIQDFVKTYNALQTTIKNLTAFDAKAATNQPLTGDGTTRSIQSSVTNALQAVLGEGTVRSLADLGISTDPQTRQLKLDQTKLDKALTGNPGDVTKLLTGTNGLAKNFEAAFKDVLGSTGSLKTRTDGLAKSISDLDAQQKRAKAASDAEMDQMRTRFVALDKYVSQLAVTGNYLTQQFAAMNKSSK